MPGAGRGRGYGWQPRSVADPVDKKPFVHETMKDPACVQDSSDTSASGDASASKGTLQSASAEGKNLSFNFPPGKEMRLGFFLPNFIEDFTFLPASGQRPKLSVMMLCGSLEVCRVSSPPGHGRHGLAAPLLTCSPHTTCGNQSPPSPEICLSYLPCTQASADI